MLFLLIVALCSLVVFSLLSVVFFFYMCCDASTVSPSSIVAHFAFSFTSCVEMLVFWSPSTAAYFAFCFTVVLRVASGPRVKLVGRKSDINIKRSWLAVNKLLTPPPTPTPLVYSTDRSKAVVPMLVLLFVDLWFILRGDLFYILPCVILFLCFSVLLAFRLPRLGKRELTLMLFVRLFDLCLFGFVGFLFLLVSGKGCGL